MLEPDLSTASLHVINTSELTPHEFDHAFFDDYRICEDTLVSCWINLDLLPPYQCGVYTSARFPNTISHGGPAVKMLLPDIGHEYRPFSCPVSGRFVLLVRDDSNNSGAVVLDFF